MTGPDSGDYTSLPKKVKVLFFGNLRIEMIPPGGLE